MLAMHALNPANSNAIDMQIADIARSGYFARPLKSSGLQGPALATWAARVSSISASRCGCLETSRVTPSRCGSCPIDCSEFATAWLHLDGLHRWCFRHKWDMHGQCTGRDGQLSGQTRAWRQLSRYGRALQQDGEPAKTAGVETLDSFGFNTLTAQTYSNLIMFILPYVRMLLSGVQLRYIVY